VPEGEVEEVAEFEGEKADVAEALGGGALGVAVGVDDGVLDPDGVHDAVVDGV
jgi:hypothetical protein